MINAHNDMIRKEVRTLIEETSFAYRSFLRHDYMNSDFADFASMALSQFKNVLRDPELTRERLEVILRKGMKKHRALDTNSCWTSFMAHYVTKSANSNQA